jgi:hypothetical protein
MIQLIVTPDGTVEGLYTEVIDLAAIGRLQIKRASSIEFDNPAQVWRVFDPKGRCVCSSPSRQECLRWEEAHFITQRERLS